PARAGHARASVVVHELLGPLSSARTLPQWARQAGVYRYAAGAVEARPRRSSRTPRGRRPLIAQSGRSFSLLLSHQSDAPLLEAVTHAIGRDNAIISAADLRSVFAGAVARAG